MPLLTNQQVMREIQHDTEEAFLPTIQEILAVFTKMQASVFDMSVLKKFYDTGLEDPLDTTTWCLPILYADMKEQFELKIKPDGFRKRLKKLERYGLIKKIPSTNPSIFEPVVSMRGVVRQSVILFLAKRGYKSL